MLWGTAPTECAREDEKLLGQRTGVAPRDVPSQVVRAVALRPSPSGSVVTAVPVCLSEMFKHIHNGGEQPANGGHAVDRAVRAADYVNGERTDGLLKEVDGPVTTSTRKALRCTAETDKGRAQVRAGLPEQATSKLRMCAARRCAK